MLFLFLVGSYIGYDQIILCNELLHLSLGVCAFLSIIQILDILNLSSHIAMLSATLRTGASAILSYMMMFVCVGAPFAFNGSIIFSNLTWAFSEFGIAASTLGNHC